MMKDKYQKKILNFDAIDGIFFFSQIIESVSKRNKIFLLSFSYLINFYSISYITTHHFYLSDSDLFFVCHYRLRKSLFFFTYITIKKKKKKKKEV
jgi:hypothetical protein